jgi:ribose 5-phosphate isomerase B
VLGVHCALCWNAEAARYAWLHNDANALTLGERLVAEDALEEIVRGWLTTMFEGGSVTRRAMSTSCLRPAGPPAGARA